MTESVLRIALAQADFLVGDIPGNIEKVLALAARARDEQGAGLVVFPELCLVGYPPEDLLLRPSLDGRIDAALARLGEVGGIHILIGYPGRRDGHLRNLAGVWRDGQCVCEYTKQELPNYQVFDEKRYFTHGHAPVVFSLGGRRLGLTLCEDIWHAGPARAARDAGAELLINLNASPFHQGKQAERMAVVGARVQETGLPVLYVNLVGGQDELVFDGGSFAMNAGGAIAAELPRFAEALATVEFGAQGFVAASRAPALSPEAEVYEALVLGVRDYVGKSGFRGAVLGLSGGIDSALTLAIAVDAIGADRVQAVMMPYHYTSTMSLEDAEAEACILGVHYSVLSIAPMVESFSATLAPEFDGLARDKTEENLQARSRGVLLMAISNKKGLMVLTTGNKSEMAVGYATLYGDMAGGFDVLKDVPKTLVFRLSEYRNALTPEHPPIPQRVIDRPPSAELAPDQKDEDSLPPYPVLDAILKRYVEDDESAEAITAAGFDAATVMRVVRMVDGNEYKRRQAAIGPRISRRGFGKDRRYPIVNGWRAGD
ncbi:MAG: synthase [Moraxellaceae bacterium]|jgi:NAD+ synthase (glutamine-hydrolysing)|nr:synthase [Moraxellaceae bacterium]